MMLTASVQRPRPLWSVRRQNVTPARRVSDDFVSFQFMFSNHSKHTEAALVTAYNQPSVII